MATDPGVAVRWATVFLDNPGRQAAAAARFWCAVTGSSLSAPRGERGEFATIVPPDGHAYLRLQELTAGPARCHLDLHVDDVPAATAAAVELGAELLAETAGAHAILTSPGGFVFCLVQHRGEAHRPAPMRWPDGHRSLVDQLCLDIPAPSLEPERRFWTSLTAWTFFGVRSDFTVLDRPPGQPVRLIFQRLDEATEGQSVAAHLDLCCDDADAEAERHVALGARVVRRKEFWVTLEDPTGRQYCVTCRNPDTGVLDH